MKVKSKEEGQKVLTKQNVTHYIHGGEAKTEKKERIKVCVCVCV